MSQWADFVSAHLLGALAGSVPACGLLGPRGECLYEHGGALGLEAAARRLKDAGPGPKGDLALGPETQQYLHLFDRDPLDPTSESAPPFHLVHGFRVGAARLVVVRCTQTEVCAVSQGRALALVVRVCASCLCGTRRQGTGRRAANSSECALAGWAAAGEVRSWTTHQLAFVWLNKSEHQIFLT
eukprot:gnl/Hemi2/1185_TR422_c0_g2_i1.p2 gnl/Hemi2/1185_TR422_c0_g2~~gnl/Hemi2/1185_TR422_c0_g2_i1.p2  ORF type:complete len:184 (+),score=32.86 gnl/Hemi2/1185_TR422_c0_g2_i1:116-667(+)